MNKSIFRQKSLDRISSPEEMDDYIKVTSPSMYIVLAAIILLLLAGIFWSITGKIESTVIKDGKEVTEEVSPISFLID